MGEIDGERRIRHLRGEDVEEEEEEERNSSLLIVVLAIVASPIRTKPAMCLLCM